MTQITTASHDMGLGRLFGSTPKEESPINGNLNALEVLGEGVLLLLAGDKNGEVVLFLKDGREVHLTRGAGMKSLVVKGL